MTCGAVIVDNRDDCFVEPVIEAHRHYLPAAWPLFWLRDEPTGTAAEYNRLLTAKRFWKGLPDKVLIFQHDSRLLKKGIAAFLEWDYVGAPWKFQQHGGNGGLSLRSRDAMLKVIEQSPPWNESQGNEDVWFCNALHRLKMKMAPRGVCESFSVESIFKTGTLGYHAIDAHLTAQQCEQIRRQYQN